MKLSPLLLAGCLFTAAFPVTGSALTVAQPVTPAYVREHPKEFSVKVSKGKDGLLAFTLVRTLVEPRYLVAHLAVHHGRKLLATSDTPSFARKHDNTFYFSVSAADVGESTFDLSESGFTESGDNPVPMPGGIIYQGSFLVERV